MITGILHPSCALGSKQIPDPVNLITYNKIHLFEGELESSLQYNQ